MRINRIIITAVLTGLMAALAAAAWGPARAEAAVVAPGALVDVDLSEGERSYAFTPASGSVYDVCLFPTDEGGGASVVLALDGQELARGEGSLTVISQRLSADRTYTLTLRGQGRVRLEVARHALSRCFDDPIPLDAGGDRYSKAIAKSGDAHWYAVTAGTGGLPVVLACVPMEDGPALEARLFDDSGRLLAEAMRTTGGACLMDFMPRTGRTYRVRVSSPEGGTGMYELRSALGEGGLPEAIALDQGDVTLMGRQSRQLSARVSPEGALDVLFWESSDPRVVRVDASGEVTGRRAGTAVITAYGAGAVRARCRVEVERVPVAGVSLLARHIDLNVGDDAALEWRLSPEYASDPRVEFEADPEGVVEVDRMGVMRAVAPGETVVTLRTLDGGYLDSLSVSVSPALRRYRALLIGEQNYAATVAAQRLGSANSVAGVRSMLGELSFGGARFEIETRLDVSRDGALRAIAEAFEGTAAQDVSLFYITCHGRYADGMTCFQMYDGSVLTAQELRQALGEVPGQIVLLVDCCGSGGAIARAGTPADILRGVKEAFGGFLGAPLFTGSRFRVLASASVEQDSYRVGFSGEGGEPSMATAFARALCEGGGWSIDRGGRCAMRADVDYDGAVSLDELYRYLARRVMWYLGLNGGDYVQTVQVSPEGDVDAVFERS